MANKYPKQHLERHIWTKDQIKTIIKLWDTETPESLADELGVHKDQLMYMVHLIRVKGLKLIRKRRNGTMSLLVEEAIKEMR